MPKPTALERILARYALAITHRDKYEQALHEAGLDPIFKTAFEEALNNAQREVKILTWVLQELRKEKGGKE